VQRLTGIGVSPGVASGRVVILIQGARTIRFSVPPERVEAEVSRLEDARRRSRTQLEAIRARLGRAGGTEMAALFDAQVLMIDDPMLVARAAGAIREQRVNAEWALQHAFDDLSSVFDEVEDPYLRERKGDLADVVGRLRMNLRNPGGSVTDLFRDIEGPYVLVADELTPSFAAQLDWTRICAFATDAGSRTYHTAILARSFHVPAVVGLHNASANVSAGDTVIVDGTNGILIVEPVPGEIAALEQREARSRGRAPARPVSGPAVTVDGLRLRLEANVELPDDIAAARDYGAEGVGLFRSEFLLARSAAEGVTEEYQYDVYRAMAERMAPFPVTVRTFDVDEDQLAGSLQAGDGGGWTDLVEHGRARLGLRAIRLSLRRRDLLSAQLRALLRAASHGRLRIMFPFVSGLEELQAAKAVLADAAADLASRGISVPDVPVGVMIEVPSAAFTADLLAREASFFTIGTNDLIQCCLAVDRTDDRVSHLYEPLHPAILRLIRTVRRAAARQGIPLSLCGEMASDPVLLSLLVGFGLTEFSMTPAAIPVARQVLTQLSASHMRRIAAHVLRLASASDIESYLMAALGEELHANAVRESS
jgi:phosphoenolpyruvate-protein phosphotransferase (PTS system enzyme I)